MSFWRFEDSRCLGSRTSLQGVLLLHDVGVPVAAC